jgi:hypothetical protein
MLHMPYRSFESKQKGGKGSKKNSRICLKGIANPLDLKYNFHSTAENHIDIGFIQIRRGALLERLGG